MVLDGRGVASRNWPDADVAEVRDLARPDRRPPDGRDQPAPDFDLEEIREAGDEPLDPEPPLGVAARSGLQGEDREGIARGAGLEQRRADEGQPSEVDEASRESAQGFEAEADRLLLLAPED